MYNTGNARKVTENQKLTFRLICQDGKRAEVVITPKFVNIPNEPERHNMGVYIDTKDLPAGVAFTINYTTVQQDTSDPDAGVIVRGNHNECGVNFNGEEFPLFSVEAADAGIQLTVAELQALIGSEDNSVSSLCGTPEPAVSAALKTARSKFKDSLKSAKTVPGSHGTLYFKAMPVEFGGTLIESYAANPSYGLE